jgi:hypothetical protein
MRRISIAIVVFLIGWNSEAFCSRVKTNGTEFVFSGVAALATLGGIFCIFLGYKLFTKGIDKHKGELKAKVKFVDIVFTGVGPGLFFMAFGAIVLITAIVMQFM